MPVTGELDTYTISVRKDKSRFKLPWSAYSHSPDYLWRDSTQPGNALDWRDEQCTAQSWPGEQPEYLGIDDFECNGIVKHYAICQVPMDIDDDEDEDDVDNSDDEPDSQSDGGDSDID